MDQTAPAAERHDVVVVGGSAGGIGALRQLLAGLPEQLAASVLVVLHLGPEGGHSALDKVLGRATALKTSFATDGEELVHGRIYVAPPGHHMQVERDVVRLSRGPMEHGTRPAIDPLFRSAAAAHGPCVIGALVSGWLDDGAAGLVAIKRRGGKVLVQDPATAVASEMPRQALRALDDAVDGVLSVEGLSRAIVELVNTPCGSVTAAAVAMRLLQERSNTLHALAEDARSRRQQLTATTYDHEAHEAHRQARALRTILVRGHDTTRS
jgi:two-component system chemotaxis response regulator CheB